MNTIGDHTLQRGGSLTPSNYPDEVFELYSIPAHDRGGVDLVPGAEIGSSKQLVQPGDVLLSKIIPHIRRVRVVGSNSGHRQIASGEWIVLRTEAYDPCYLRHFLLSDGFHEQFMNTVAGVGGSLVRARPQFVKQIPAPLPPVEEQRRIAAILDQADTIRTKRRQVLTHLDALPQALFRATFGEPTTWAARWQVGTIGELADSAQYGTSSPAGAAGAWPVLRMGNLTDDARLDLLDLKYMDLAASDVPKYTLRRGDLLFNRTNSKEKVGKACVIHTDQKLAYAGYLVRVRFPETATADFVATYLTSPYGKAVRMRLAKAAVNQANINAKEMQAIKIAHPPLPLRQQFAEQLEAVRVQREQVQRVLVEDDALFAALQSRAFRGEL